MTEEKLKTCRGKELEIQLLQAQIESLYDTRKAVWTVIESGKRDLSGPIPRTLEKIDKLRERMEQTALQYIAEREEIEKWLEAVTDMNFRNIVRLHFLMGYSWAQTCKKVYGYADPDTCRKYYQRKSQNFLEN